MGILKIWKGLSLVSPAILREQFAVGKGQRAKKFR